jgi:hypothetical protein
VTFEFSGRSGFEDTRITGAQGPVRVPLYARLAAALALAAVGLGVVRAARSAEPRRGLACPQTVALDDDAAGYSFGHGAVDVDCGGAAVFGFAAPPRAQVLFHYRVMHAGELEVRFNGKHLAWARVASEPQALALPESELRADGRNLVSFSRAGEDGEWSVDKVSVEVLDSGSGDPDLARRAYERGRRKLEERRVAPRNLYDAWMAFTDARREMGPSGTTAALQAEVAQSISGAERDLERDCGRLLFSAARFERYGEADKAQQAYREVLLHFPGDDPTGCRRKAQENIVSTEALDAP